MLWLIELVAEKVIAEIGIPPVYITRGDPDAWDYNIGDFRIEQTWRELNLSGLVPAGAKAVHVRVGLKNNIINETFSLKKFGQTNSYVGVTGRPLIGTLLYEYDWIVAISEDRKLEYRITDNGTWTQINFCVKGWIL